jgi:hypothetical protein
MTAPKISELPVVAGQFDDDDASDCSDGVEQDQTSTIDSAAPAAAVQQKKAAAAATKRANEKELASLFFSGDRRVQEGEEPQEQWSDYDEGLLCITSCIYYRLKSVLTR